MNFSSKYLPQNLMCKKTNFRFTENLKKGFFYFSVFLFLVKQNHIELSSKTRIGKERKRKPVNLPKMRSSPRFSLQLPRWKKLPEKPRFHLKPGTQRDHTFCAATIACNRKWKWKWVQLVRIVRSRRTCQHRCTNTGSPELSSDEQSTAGWWVSTAPS